MVSGRPRGDRQGSGHERGEVHQAEEKEDDPDAPGDIDRRRIVESDERDPDPSCHVVDPPKTASVRLLFSFPGRSVKNKLGTFAEADRSGRAVGAGGDGLPGCRCPAPAFRGGCAGWRRLRCRFSGAAPRGRPPGAVQGWRRGGSALAGSNATVGSRGPGRRRGRRRRPGRPSPSGETAPPLAANAPRQLHDGCPRLGGWCRGHDRRYCRRRRPSRLRSAATPHGLERLKLRLAGGLVLARSDAASGCHGHGTWPSRVRSAATLRGLGRLRLRFAGGLVLARSDADSGCHGHGTPRLPLQTAWLCEIRLRGRMTSVDRSCEPQRFRRGWLRPGN